MVGNYRGSENQHIHVIVLDALVRRVCVVTQASPNILSAHFCRTPEFTAARLRQSFEFLLLVFNSCDNLDRATECPFSPRSLTGKLRASTWSKPNIRLTAVSQPFCRPYRPTITKATAAKPIANSAKAASIS